MLHRVELAPVSIRQRHATSEWAAGATDEQTPGFRVLVRGQLATLALGGTNPH
jgi:hypothetical protein